MEGTRFEAGKEKDQNMRKDKQEKKKAGRINSTHPILKQRSSSLLSSGSGGANHCCACLADEDFYCCWTFFGGGGGLACRLGELDGEVSG